MSSDLASVLEFFQIYNYSSLAVVTAVVYDYLITLSSEIDYVWRRPWTCVSTLFVIVRYVGLSWAIWYYAYPRPSESVCIQTQIASYGDDGFHSCTEIYQVANWGYVIFLAAADLVMILRVYAMWNQSKMILYVMLSTYVSQTIVSFVFAGIYYNSLLRLSVVVIQITNLFFCSYSLRDVPPLLPVYDKLPRLILGTALLVLAVIQTLKQSINVYNATKQWRPNRYIRLLVRDGILYFLVMAVFNISALIADLSNTTNSFYLLLKAFSTVAICIMMPRFIIDVRELYDRDLRERWQGIDTGFGVLTQSVSSQQAAVSALGFADVASGQGETVEGNAVESEGIQLEERGDNVDRG